MTNEQILECYKHASEIPTKDIHATDCKFITNILQNNNYHKYLEASMTIDIVRCNSHFTNHFIIAVARKAFEIGKACTETEELFKLHSK